MWHPCSIGSHSVPFQDGLNYQRRRSVATLYEQHIFAPSLTYFTLGSIRHNIVWWPSLPLVSKFFSSDCGAVLGMHVQNVFSLAVQIWFGFFSFFLSQDLCRLPSNCLFPIRQDVFVLAFLLSLPKWFFLKCFPLVRPRSEVVEMDVITVSAVCW